MIGTGLLIPYALVHFRYCRLVEAQGVELCERQYRNMRLESGLQVVERCKQLTASVSWYRTVEQLERRGQAVTAAAHHVLLFSFGPEIFVATRGAGFAYKSPVADMFRMTNLNCCRLMKSVLNRRSVDKMFPEHF